MHTAPCNTGWVPAIDQIPDRALAIADDGKLAEGRKLFVYAVGRELGPVDRLRLDLAVDGLLARGTLTLVDLVQIVVHSDAFQWRAAGP